MEGATSKMEEFLRDLESERVSIKVGKESDYKEFSIPKELLCRRSEWFRNALKENRFSEGETKTVALPEDSPDVFEIFVYYLYQQCLTFPEESHFSPGEMRGKELILLTRLWAFSGKLLQLDLQSCVVFRLGLLLNENVNPEPIPGNDLATAFRKAEDNSPIRILIGDYIVKTLESTDSKYQVHKRLANSPGFFKVLHESEAAFHTLPNGDFPRQYKPLKFAKLLGIDRERVFPNGKNDSEMVNYWGTRYDVSYHCNECGYESEEVHPECKECKKEKCDCISPQWVNICEDCVYLKHHKG